MFCQICETAAVNFDCNANLKDTSMPDGAVRHREHKSCPMSHQEQLANNLQGRA